MIPKLKLLDREKSFPHGASEEKVTIIGIRLLFIGFKSSRIKF